MSPAAGQAPKIRISTLKRAESHLTSKRSWSQSQRQNTAKVGVSLFRKIPARGFSLIGLSGAPGCGKSTLAGLVNCLVNQSGTRSIVVSLDDYYLGKQHRTEAAKDQPLFAQRGVPGTHDWDQLIRDLDHLRHGKIENVRLPVFDKMKDDRLGDEYSKSIPFPPDVVILEGWLIGAPPQAATSLKPPVNQLEVTHDQGGFWRLAVNNKLEKYYQDLESRLDAKWFMKVPNWTQVINWRWQQEHENMLANQIGHLKSREEVSVFLDQFQRIALHMLNTSIEWANVIIDIDTNHHLRIDQG